MSPPGRVVTGRSRPALLGHKGTTRADGMPLVDGRPWPEPDVLADVRKIVGARAASIHNETAERSDVLPLLVATDGAIAAFGRDGQRLRPNLIIGGVDGLDEREWPGRKRRIGRFVTEHDSLRGRCVMTTYDPDTLQHDATALNHRPVAAYAWDIVSAMQAGCAGAIIERPGKALDMAGPDLAVVADRILELEGEPEWNGSH